MSYLSVRMIKEKNLCYF